ncbi:site-specific integrase [Dankookia rubra]|uniref:Site-specific integrase n=1 Tax=Dankookia rubra TaxID=1442381 RepID=A0A4V3A963_9PROT|nr:site-specific integrase [Dankookia rubra]TDH58005.1 site-specific integrase [Dankookia rubra]
MDPLDQPVDPLRAPQDRHHLTDPAQCATALPLAKAIVARLERHARHAQGALAPETERALRKTSAAFTGWTTAQGLVALPATAETVATYVDALAAQERKPASVRQAVWAIATLHRAAGLPDLSKAEPVRLALKRMARSLGTRQRQAAPLGDHEVARILATAGTDLAAIRDVALVLTMRDLLARRSEVVALDLEDLSRADGGAGTALIRRSKTDQAGLGEVRWLSPETCLHLRRWIKAAGIEDGPVFRPVNKAGMVGTAALQGGEVSRILKRLAARAGLDPATISGHSARVGMAQDLVAGGADLAAVMQAGRWKSPTMPARYAERLLAKRGAVAGYYDKRG